MMVLVIVGRDPCQPNPCRNGGTCQPTNSGSFMCMCPAGYEGICCEIRERSLERVDFASHYSPF